MLFGLLSVWVDWRPVWLEVELTLGASERHLSSPVICSPVAWSLSSNEFAAALGEMLGVRPVPRICDMSEPRRLVIFLKPVPEQKHLQIIRLNANRKSFENNAYTSGFMAELPVFKTDKEKNKQRIWIQELCCQNFQRKQVSFLISL